MTTMTRHEVERRREEIVVSMVSVLDRWAKSRHLLTDAQRLYVAETLRDVADEIDSGAGDWLRCRFAKRRRMAVVGSKRKAFRFNI